jgi:hypothetical protein
LALATKEINDAGGVLGARSALSRPKSGAGQMIRNKGVAESAPTRVGDLVAFIWHAEIKKAVTERKRGGRMNSALFVVASASLLAIPGPTNTLLATSGASIGLRRSAHLLAAELGGYLSTIAILRFFLGPWIAATPTLGGALRMAVAIYLIFLAIKLWRHGNRQTYEGAPITFYRVFITTLPIRKQSSSHLHFCRSRSASSTSSHGS